MSSHFVKTPHFEGPLDLLLHLIKVHELDIFAIDLYVVTAQYLDHLRFIEFRDLGDAASFLAMAAHLIDIKTKSLLPRDTSETEAGAAEEEEDPQRSLQARLQLYDTMRRAAEALAARRVGDESQRASSEWKRWTEIYADVEAPVRGEAITLLVLYEQMLTQVAERRPASTVTATRETVTVEETMTALRQQVESLRFLMFQRLYPKIATRYELVAHVLAILQLCRDRMMKIHQEDEKGLIWMYRTDLNEADLPQDDAAPERGTATMPAAEPKREVTVDG